MRDAAGLGAVALVELVETTTGLTRATDSTAAGDYAFPNLLPGEYLLRASAPGFKAFERRGLRIRTQSVVTLDITLEVGAVTELVTVEGEAPLVDQATASIGTLVDRAWIDALPSAGRNIFITATLAPTVLATGDAQFVRQQDQSNSSLISLGGGPRRNNTYVLDGVPIVDALNRATLIPNLQAVDEVRVQLSAYDAEIGRTSGGVFNVTARSGSNAFRGNALYQNRPDWAVGRLFFAARNGIENPDSYYHLYSGGVGGPIRRNRTFFWASTEGYRTSTARNTVLVLPTDAERRGDFSQSGMTLYDPLTTRPDPGSPGRFIRDPFPNNRIPADRLNPVAQALLQYLPLPTSGKSRAAVASIVDRADQITGKVTHRWTDEVTSTGLYAWYESMEPDAAFYGRPLFDNPADPGGGAFVRGATVLALNTVWTPGARSVVAMRYGYNDLDDDNRPSPFDPSALGFAPAYLDAVPLKKFPNIGVTDYGRGGSFLGDRPQDRAAYRAHTLNASVSTLVGRHTVKLGGESRLHGLRFQNVGGMGGFNFNREFTVGPNPNAPAASTGDAFASFLLGFPSSGGISVSSRIDAEARYWSAFVQDDVRVTPALALNLGLRYDYELGLGERNNRLITGWAFDEPFPVQVGGLRPDGTPLALTGGFRYAGADGAPTRQGDPNPWQFAPRLGAVPGDQRGRRRHRHDRVQHRHQLPRHRREPVRAMRWLFDHQPLSRWRQPAGRQQPGAAHGRRQQRQLRRSGQPPRVSAPVFARPAARGARQSGGGRRLPRRVGTTVDERHRRVGTEHQPARSAVSRVGLGSAGGGAEPVLWDAARRRHPGRTHRPARTAPAPIPAVRRGVPAAGQPLPFTVRRARPHGRPAAARWMGAPDELHLEPDAGQPVLGE